ncbi:recombinase family protein [Actinomadura sp. SCN-SB]|uniref:recombinase family protein n=1 Tax=Actinomadura sp. SCN-SB TaxID=3373092 RepID=UPI0037500006
MQHVAAFSANEGVQREARLFAFYGRVSTEDNQDPEASRAWQLRRANALIEPKGGRIVAEFFDVDKSRSIPWARRPQATELINQLKNPARDFDAVVIGEPHRAFYGNQYSLTFPLFEHFGIPLWVPEVGGPVDPANEAHDMIMGVFGGLSKGERNRIKIRVRSAMAAITSTEGRFLGGRPPYGYRLVDAGPHPNPAKAADGKRLHRLVIDEFAAAVVQRIFAEFLGLWGYRERGYFAIAEGLTRDGIPCPSAHDPARNRHRCGVAWSKNAVRAILMNPRYTGYQVWNKQRKDEVLLDVEDVALGHTTKQRWNPRDRWVFSDKIVHPVIIEMDIFEQAQRKLLTRRPQTGRSKPRHTKRCYPLKGALWCDICERKMQAHHSGHATYYRCRFPEEYGLANKIEHPRNVYVREDHVLPDLDRWLGLVLAPHRIAESIKAMQQAQMPTVADSAVTRAKAVLKDCAAKLDRHRAALEAGGNSATIARWIAEIEAEQAAAEKALREAQGCRVQVLGEEEIAGLVRQVDDLRQVIPDAEPEMKAKLYERLGLKMTYCPGNDEVRAEIRFSPDCVGYRGVTDGVRGGT